MKEKCHFSILLDILLYQKYPLRGRACYRIKGKVTEDFGLFSIEAESVEKLAYRGDPRYG